MRSGRQRRRQYLREAIAEAKKRGKELQQSIVRKQAQDTVPPGLEIGSPPPPEGRYTVDERAAGIMEGYRGDPNHPNLSYHKNAAEPEYLPRANDVDSWTKLRDMRVLYVEHYQQIAREAELDAELENIANAHAASDGLYDYDSLYLTDEEIEYADSLLQSINYQQNMHSLRGTTFRHIVFHPTDWSLICQYLDRTGDAVTTYIGMEVHLEDEQPKGHAELLDADAAVHKGYADELPE